LCFIFSLLFVSSVKLEWISEMENANLFQGDIVLDPDEKPSSIKNTYASMKGGRWPGAIIPYDINTSISYKVRQNIPKAIELYEKNTCLRFKKRTTEKEYIHFFSGDGCSSPVGYRKWRKNEVSLSYGCSGVGTIIHEIGHSIGLHHEQSRPDRDSYVKIIWDNIEPKMDYNFYKESSYYVDSLGTPYDFQSIMHYNRTAFGKGKVTIETVDPINKYKIGRRHSFSAMDIKQINLMYCKNWKPTTNSPSISTAPVKGTTKSTASITDQTKPTLSTKTQSVITSSGKCVNQWRPEDCVFWLSDKGCREHKFLLENCCKSCYDKYGFIPTSPKTTPSSFQTTIPPLTTKPPISSGVKTTTGHICVNEWSPEDCSFWITENMCKTNAYVQRKCCKSCLDKWA